MSSGCAYCGMVGCSIETCPERLDDRYGDPGWVGLSDAEKARVARSGPHRCDICNSDFSTMDALLEHDCQPGGGEHT